MIAVPPQQRASSPLLLAKKKGGGGKKGGKKGGNKKQSGFAWASNFELAPTESAALRELADLACSTYRTRTGKSLNGALDKGGDLPKALWSAPVCVMIVRKAEGAGGSVVTYANLAAAEAHGLASKDGYKQLIEQPTPLAAALGDGKYDSGYEKKLQAIASSEDGGGSFTIRECQRWALEKMAIVDGKLASEPIGLCYAWERWELEDGTSCKPGGERVAPSIDPAEVQAAVDAQAVAIRALKEEQGLTNSDEEVKEAVAELLRLKALLPAE